MKKCKDLSLRRTSITHTRTHRRRHYSSAAAGGGKLPGECPIKAKRRRRPARSRIPLTPVQSLPEHTPHHNTPHHNTPRHRRWHLSEGLWDRARMCVCVCVFNVWLSGLVKNSRKPLTEPFRRRMSGRNFPHFKSSVCEKDKTRQKVFRTTTRDGRSFHCSGTERSEVERGGAELAWRRGPPR